MGISREKESAGISRSVRRVLSTFLLGKRLRLMGELGSPVSQPDVVAARYQSESPLTESMVAIPNISISHIAYYVQHIELTARRRAPQFYFERSGSSQYHIATKINFRGTCPGTKISFKKVGSPSRETARPCDRSNSRGGCGLELVILSDRKVGTEDISIADGQPVIELDQATGEGK